MVGFHVEEEEEQNSRRIGREGREEKRIRLGFRYLKGKS